MESTQMSTNKRMNNEIVAYLHNGTLNNKKKNPELHKFEFISQNQWWAKNFQTKEKSTRLFHLHLLHLRKVQKQAKIDQFV